MLGLFLAPTSISPALFLPPVAPAGREATGLAGSDSGGGPATAPVAAASRHGRGSHRGIGMFGGGQMTDVREAGYYLWNISKNQPVYYVLLFT